MNPGKRILIVCTGNSCRSQMAEAYLTAMGSDVEVHSAGTHPADEVHPLAMKVMMEDGYNIDIQYPKNISLFTEESFDYLITVCSEAEKECPVFAGEVTHRLHIPFRDPVQATGSEDEVLAVFRQVRDEIKQGMEKFYNSLH